MLPGFDTQTAPLSDAEREALPLLRQRLLQAYGKDGAVYNDELQRLTGLTSARIRKCINHLRTTEDKSLSVPCLIAGSKGYYIAETEQEIKDYEQSLFGREMAIRQVRARIAEQRLARFSGGYQGRLF